ncbi:hypothetical protein D3OALGA1CA_93 [Olavius algarvensis associated proteobacterium Delta 3]|nr:hypothetical protein D3OALGA1CA_93 [Olavius algarvensis associated proteobacterium Delta 3]
MRGDEIIQQIQAHFPKAEPGRLFFAKKNILLEETYGFTPENTRFAEGGCCDEINEPELELLQRYWGGRFKFGGLAGYCHGGRSALGAVSHHVPEVNGQKNLLLVGGPHIGLHQGRWGEIPRPGQQEITTSCGSLCAVLHAGCDALRNKAEDPLDRQQRVVEQIMLPFLLEHKNAGHLPEVVAATRFLMKRIDDDLFSILTDLTNRFDGQIAVITGVTVNTVEGNFFSLSRFEVLS